MTATPSSDWDSMCSMSLTVVVIARSLMETMRRSISWAGSPLYIHMTVTTGMSMLGKISFGIWTNESTPITMSSRAITVKV